MIQNLCTVLVTTLAVCLTGCQNENTAPSASTEQAIPEQVQEVSNDVVAEELPFIIDDAELEEITANDVDQEIAPATEGSLQ